MRKRRSLRRGCESLKSKREIIRMLLESGKEEVSFYDIYEFATPKEALTRREFSHLLRSVASELGYVVERIRIGKNSIYRIRRCDDGGK